MLRCVVLFFALVLSLSPLAKADCDYCVHCEHQGMSTCSHSGTFPICGELGRVQCAAETGDNCSVDFGKCGLLSGGTGGVTTLTRDPSGLSIHIPDKSVARFLMELKAIRNSTPN
jgi:hypothetical protein